MLQVTAKTEKLQPLRREQRTVRFREKYRKRVKVEHRISRMVQLGVRQARYLGSKKLAFQIAGRGGCQSDARDVHERF